MTTHPKTTQVTTSTSTTNNTNNNSKQEENISQDSESINTESDPLHDPNADDEDEEWVISNLLKATSLSTEMVNTISCPRCFVTLSFQSQPHDSFQGQFRAIAVINVKIDSTCRIKVKDFKGIDQADENNYVPVVCDSCGIHVGAKDKQNVYHFFNVLYGQSF